MLKSISYSPGPLHVAEPFPSILKLIHEKGYRYTESRLGVPSCHVQVVDDIEWFDENDINGAVSYIALENSFTKDGIHADISEFKHTSLAVLWDYNIDGYRITSL